MSSEPGKVNIFPDGDLGEKLQKLNDELVYPCVNNGVYRYHPLRLYALPSLCRGDASRGD